MSRSSPLCKSCPVADGSVAPALQAAQCFEVSKISDALTYGGGEKGQACPTCRLVGGKPSACFTTMPTELLELIMGFCGEADLVFLSLTCRWFHCIAPHIGLPRGVSKENEAIGRMLAPWAPGYSFCPSRGKLVAFSTRSLEGQLLAYHDCGSADPQFDGIGLQQSFLASHCYRLSWCTAHLVTNRHFYGHGLPVSALSHAHGSQHSPGP